MSTEFKRARKYPVSFEEYCKKHVNIKFNDVFHKLYGHLFAKDRYKKAKFVYNCMKYPQNTYDCPWMQEWYDCKFGKLKKPEDAFEVWWDV